MNVNLIASTFRHGEEDARDELDETLRDFGDPNPECILSKISGIVFAYSTIDPFDVIIRFKELVKNEPWKVHYILRVLPIEIVLPTSIANIVSASSNLGKKIQPGESFRITIEKRHTSMSSSAVIAQVANHFTNKVSLDWPDWIILIEIIGSIAGVSVLRPDQVFSSILEKRRNAI
ncbi:MAG: THUMP domain-containing protein [Nitrososphaeraceae archaeon]